MTHEQQNRDPDLPDNPRGHQEETVDALERRLRGHDERPAPADDDEAPAFEQDLDENDLGRKGSEPSD